MITAKAGRARTDGRQVSTSSRLHVLPYPKTP
jgi:hypothetical protein